MLTDIASAFGVAKKKYDKGGNALAETLLVGARCLVALNNHATLRRFGMFAGLPKIEYWVAEDKGALSRPYHPDLFIADVRDFNEEARPFAEELRTGHSDPVRFDSVVYTTVSAFCLCYDVWKPKCRKTPGTFFEVLMASAARVRFPGLALTKHIPIKDLPVAARRRMRLWTCQVKRATQWKPTGAIQSQQTLF